MVVEAIGTFFLVWAIIGVAVNPRATGEWAALAIGGALGMAVMVLAPLTGAGSTRRAASGRRSCPANGAEPTRSCSSTWSVRWWARWWPAFLYFQIFIAPGKKGVGGVEPVG